MATLIKVDNKFINLDNVTEVHSYDLHGWNVIVYYAQATGNSHNGNGHNGNGHSGNGHSGEIIQQDFEHFTGHEADALREWLEQHATDVLAWHKAHERNMTMYSREIA